MSGETQRFPIEERLSWRRWVTPKLLKEKPIHRWYTFPHSFTGELVHALVEEWALGQEDKILDPFAGAGTTLVSAKERGIPATGYDLSPLAVLVTRVKTTSYDVSRLKEAWRNLENSLDPSEWTKVVKTYPELVEKALPNRLLGAFDAIANAIRQLPYSQVEQDFFLVALLSILPQYSDAVATGGWLKWVDKGADERNLPTVLAKQVEMMFKDLCGTDEANTRAWHIAQADARSLPNENATYSAVITSPPYPNRHDYTRVFGVELMFAFLNWKETRQLRYQSFHSHPEARPERPSPDGYAPPRSLICSTTRISSEESDPRVVRMIEGYFLDMYLSLLELKRVCIQGAKIALVVGNVQYRGETIAVDELTAEIGEQAGLRCKTLFVARLRGNSAQQMKLWGKNPSRETVVTFLKP